MATKTLKEKKADKIAKVLHEAKMGQLHSGKGGKVVTNPKQKIAIALSEAEKIGKKKK